MLLVGFFLSECAIKENPAKPPARLGVKTWVEAYGLFFEKLGGNRDPQRFAASLANVRSPFDGRWRAAGESKSPRPRLSKRFAAIKKQWQNRDEELWNAVRPFITRNK